MIKKATPRLFYFHCVTTTTVNMMRCRVAKVDDDTMMHSRDPEDFPW